MITAYPVRGKAKSVEICRAFIQGCRGTLALDPPATLYPGTAFFYGIDASNRHLWEQVLRENRDYYYCDNSYFDQTRQTYFRVTRNRIQHNGFGPTDARRFDKLGIAVNQVRAVPDGHVVFCPQSDWFMQVIARYPNWQRDARHAFSTFLPGHTHRVREWDPDKAKLARSLPEDLIGAYALVTHSSAAAVTAILLGVPIFCATECAAFPMSSVIDVATREVFINTPLPSEVRLWAGTLADNQWTLDEMRDGTAQAMLLALEGVE